MRTMSGVHWSYSWHYWKSDMRQTECKLKNSKKSLRRRNEKMWPGHRTSCTPINPSNFDFLRPSVQKSAITTTPRHFRAVSVCASLRLRFHPACEILTSNDEPFDQSRRLDWIPWKFFSRLAMGLFELGFLHQPAKYQHCRGGSIWKLLIKFAFR